MTYIDLTRTLRGGMPVYPGDVPVKLLHDKIFERDGYNNFILTTGMHVGTHIDLPMHMTDKKIFASEFALDAFISEGVIIHAYNEESIAYHKEYDELVTMGSIVLIDTCHSRYYGTPKYDFHPVLSEPLAAFLAEKQVKMIGIDCPSVDVYPFPVHQYLLNRGIFIIENLMNLELLSGLKKFQVIALPLKIEADSALARVIACV